MRPLRNSLLLCVGAATSVIPTAILFLGVSSLFVFPLVIGVVVFCLGMSRRESKLVMPAIALVTCAWVGPILFVVYQSSSGSSIEFIVPADYQGTIEVIKDRKNGQDLQLAQGKYVIVFPSSGVLRVKNTNPFHHWHQESCRDINGQRKQLEAMGVTIGTIETGPHTSEGSAAFDGTTHRWNVR